MVVHSEKKNCADKNSIVCYFINFFSSQLEGEFYWHRPTYRFHSRHTYEYKRMTKRGPWIKEPPTQNFFQPYKKIRLDQPPPSPSTQNNEHFLDTFESCSDYLAGLRCRPFFEEAFGWQWISDTECGDNEILLFHKFDCVCYLQAMVKCISKMLIWIMDTPHPEPMADQKLLTSSSPENWVKDWKVNFIKLLDYNPRILE